MNRSIFLIIILISVFQISNVMAGPDDPVYFADANLKAAVEAHLGISDPTENDMLGLLIHFVAIGLDITDLTGFEYATTVTWPTFDDNQISDISPLASLTNLQALSLENNQISNISAISDLTNLEVLWLSNNQISDISAISGLTNLNECFLENNQISNIPPLDGLTNMRFLVLNNNQISNISGLSGLINSIRPYLILYMNNNQISDISPLSGLTKLVHLELNGNQISDISPLAGLTYLRNLDLQDNQISDISPLAGLTNLYTLYLQGNPLNQEAYDIYIPQIRANNPGIELLYDAPPPPPEPVANFSYSPEEPLAGQTITFDAYLSYDLDGTIELYEWDFGDGESETSSDSVVLHTYYEPGEYPVTLTVTDNDGFKDSELQILTIYPVLPNPIEQPEMGFLVGEIDFNDPNDFVEKIQGNNFEDSDNPQYNRIHVEYVEGLEPDPAGMMRLQNLEDLNPASPSYGRTIHARAKGFFGQCDNSRVLISFSYLFERSAPSLELVIYLSDVPKLLDQADPLWSEHNIEIGRVSVPPEGRPGSIGSGRFGTFEASVSTGLLDLSDGIWVELMLVENQSQLNRTYTFNSISRFVTSDTSSGSVLVDDWTVEVHCDGICMDLNWSDVPDEEDLLLVIASCGESTGLLEGGVGSRVCLDGPFSTDGFVDSSDIAAWDWALSDENRPYLLNLCKVPISEDISVMGLASVGPEDPVRPISVMGLPDPLSDLLIAGKRYTSEYPAALTKDRLYAFNSNYQYQSSFDPEFDRCSIRLVKGPEGNIYQINSERGIARLDIVDEVIVPPGGRTTYANEPRYNESATVYVGIQDGIKGPFGRPVLDAAFDANYVYIVPVVVNPDGEDAYLAAAKLQLLDGQNPPYQVVRLYDDPPNANDNQHRNHLREIEIDGAGNIYVINAHSLNESDILWKYGPDGTPPIRVDLGNPNSSSYVPDPVAMHVSDVTNMVYLTSGLKDKVPDSKTIYCFSKDLMALENSIVINGMQHVTDITEDPAGTLWIVGFNMIEEIPDYPDPSQSPFYYPTLAKVSSDGNSVEVTTLLGTSDLGLPMSIVWTEDN